MNKEKSVKSSIVNVLTKNKVYTIALIILIIFVVVVGLIPPQILKHIIDYNFVDNKKDGLITSALLYIFIVFLIGIFDFSKEAVLTVLGEKITKEIRLDMMIKLEKINAIYFSKNESGQIVSRFTNDVDAINSMFSSGIISMIIDSFKIIGVVISIWAFSSKLGFITLCILPLIYIITRMFQKRMLNAQIESRKLIGKVNNHISESFKNILMIKSFSKEEYMEESYKDVLMDNFEAVEKVNFYDSIFSPVVLLIRAVVIGLIVILSSQRINFFGISLGMVAASIDLISSLFTPVENLGIELQSIQKSVSGIKRVNEFFNEKEDKKKNINELALDSKKLYFKFNDVSFSYDKRKNVLVDINLEIKPNENITFVGRTGVGKTTLFKLIAGLLRPTEGNITLNGINVYDIPNSEKRNILGYVEQSFHMIKGTVAEQISLGDNNISMEQVKKALDYVGLTDYINTLENKYDTFINNENLFSQGQKQLLSIARAIVTDPPILLFDEITANLDSITEDKIVSILQMASQEHTILTISHRLSSMISSDRIVILENGKIKNSGTPEELLQNDEWYKNHIALEKLTWK
ncbi:MAG: ABC transporter ATP-binding protein [Tissierellia bacterium]|nr:ABC transporter ATP-binding protein [Tissierellia bacterium]MDD4780689.1 ABC transporter ATP-binding protein [Tissierellia bacterium]